MNALWPILRQALGNLRKTAVVDDQRSYTYKQLLGGALFMADQIEKRTSKANVGIMLPTSGAFPMALLGAWIAGRTAVPLNYLLNKSELAYVIKDSGIDTIITVGPMLEFVGGDEAIPEGVGLLRMDEVDFAGFPPLRWPALPSGDDVGVILYTSGTSGRPKGVMLTHHNLAANVQGAFVHAELDSTNTFLGVLPQFHTFGLTALTLLPLWIGAKVVYTARFLPRKIVQLMREHRPDLFVAIPSMYGALLSVKNAGPEDFASLTSAVSGGEALPQVVYEGFLERFNVRILEGYGLTETSPILTWCTPVRCKRRSVGQALPKVSLQVIDEQDRPVQPGEDGEVVAAGPNIMAGYYHLPEETEKVFIDLPDPAEGGKVKRYFRTGDFGRLDDEGYLYITGRKKEMIIVGGENVFPREIEEALERHPSVTASGVVGRSDGMRGEVPVAFVEVAEGETFDESALRSWCREQLASYKCPRDIQAVDQLPRGATGKVLRRELKQRVDDQSSAEE